MLEEGAVDGRIALVLALGLEGVWRIEVGSVEEVVAAG